MLAVSLVCPGKSLLPRLRSSHYECVRKNRTWESSCDKRILLTSYIHATIQGHDKEDWHNSRLSSDMHRRTCCSWLDTMPNIAPFPVCRHRKGQNKTSYEVFELALRLIEWVLSLRFRLQFLKLSFLYSQSHLSIMKAVSRLSLLAVALLEFALLESSPLPKISKRRRESNHVSQPIQYPVQTLHSTGGLLWRGSVRNFSTEIQGRGW